MGDAIMERTLARRINPATRAISAVLGVALAIAGLHHGVLEILQGNRPTGGALFMAIVPGQLMWTDGSEGAFTLIQNFLATGVAASLVALAAAVFSLFYLDRRRGPLIFLLLFVLLVLVGGGIGFIAFLVPVWAYATRIDKPLAGWRKIIPEGARSGLANLWKPLLWLTVIAFVIALEISIFGIVAGLGAEQAVLWMCWSFLGVAWLLVHATYACGAAADIAHRP
jgi:hypothetical protein